MPDLEQRIRTWTSDSVADVEPVTLDEILGRAAGATLPDPAADPEQRSRRTWLAAAAVVVLLAATLAAISLLRPRDDGAVADLSPTMQRLIELGPAELDAQGATFADVAAARDHAGLSSPAAGIDGPVDNFVIELLEETGVSAAPPFGLACDQVTLYGCWTELGLDPTRFDGWVTWGGGDRAVIIGDFEPDTLVDAARSRDDLGAVDVDGYRGIDTVSVSGLGSTDDPSVSLSQLDLYVASLDGVILLTNSEQGLHEMIDRAIDGGPTIESDPAIAMVGSLDDVYGVQLWRQDDWPFSAVADLQAPWEAGEPQRMVTALAAPGESAQALSEGMESKGNEVLRQLAEGEFSLSPDYTFEEIDDARAAVSVDGDVVSVDVVDAPELNPRELDNPNFASWITYQLRRELGIVENDEETGDETASDEVMSRLAELAPGDLDASTEWVDLSRARRALGLTKPRPGASDMELGDYEIALSSGAGVASSSPGDLFISGHVTTFWKTLGVDTFQADGWVAWDHSSGSPANQVVVLGPFGPDSLADSVPDAVGISGESDPPREGEYRGVTTFSWPGPEPTLMNENYGFAGLHRGAQLHVAAIDGAVLVSRDEAGLHATIDRALDDLPTVFDDPGTNALLSAHLDEGAWALRTSPGLPGSGVATIAAGAGPVTDEPRWASMLVVDEDIEAEATRLQAAGDDVLNRFRADLPSPLDAMEVQVGTYGPVVVVDLTDFPTRPLSGTTYPHIAAIDGEIPEDFFSALFGALTPGATVDSSFG
jgi:hypothetical protein